MVENIKLNKKSLLYLGIILIIALFVFAGLFYYISQLSKIEIPAVKPSEAKPTKESIIKSLSAPAPNPAEVPVSVSEEIQKNLSATSENQGQEKTSEDILKGLSAPK